MKNIFLYYIAILVPIMLLIYFWQTFTSGTAVVLIILYALVYRTFLDGYRLYQLKVLSQKDIWKMIIPGMHGKYFKSLYLKL